MMQNQPQQLFLNDAGSVAYHNGVNVEPRYRDLNPGILDAYQKMDL